MSAIQASTMEQPPHRSVISDDAYRIYGKYSVVAVLKALVVRRTFRPIFTMRMCQAIARAPALLKLSLPLFKVMHAWARHRSGMDLPWQVVIGRGLAIDHGWGLVVNAAARLGNNVTLYHGVTLGNRDRIDRNGVRSSGYPVIEDEVWIGPHAVIVGAVRIGRGSRIAAGAFVTQDVPPHSVVAGNPARVVKDGCVADVLNVVVDRSK